MSLPATMQYDVALVGGGPAGLAAGPRAAEHGARVIIIDSGLRPGGQIWRHHSAAALPSDARHWLSRLERTNAEWMLRATVVDGDITRGLTVVTPTGTTRVAAPRIILATGARELFLPYPGWTLPNVMGIGGAQAMLKGGLDVRGKRVIIAGSGPLLLPVAAAMAKGGARLIAVAEQASARQVSAFAASLWSQPGKLVLAARYGTSFPLRAHRTGTWVERADGTGRLESVTLRSGKRRWVEQCDLLCSSYGLVPSTEVARLFGCDIRNGRVVVDALQRTSIPGVLSAGESTGVAGEAASIAEGEIAGLTVAASTSATIPGDLRRRQRQGRQFADRLLDTFKPRDEVRRLADAATVVCRCEDVRLGQLDPSWVGRQAKLYTRAGMGPCQGAVCGPALEQLFGWTQGSVRPPLFAPLLSAWMADAVSSNTSVVPESATE